MKNSEIIKQAQIECGEYATGYKGDINHDNLRVIMGKIWKRSVNLGYSFLQWNDEMIHVIGKRNYARFIQDFIDFQQEKINSAKYFVFHGYRYCA